MFQASYSWSGPQLPKGCGCILSPMHKKIPDSYSKREGGNPRNSGLSSQQWMVVHYLRTVWKICYAEHKETGKTYKKKKKRTLCMKSKKGTAQCQSFTNRSRPIRLSQQVYQPVIKYCVIPWCYFMEIVTCKF